MARRVGSIAAPGRRPAGGNGLAGADGGFTVIEMLIVMIIISILAAIAIPTISSQRGKARDTATKTDARNLALAVQDWFFADAAAPAVQIAAGRFEVGGRDVGAASPGTVVSGGNPAVVDTTGWTPTAWCLSLTNPSGSIRAFRVSAQRGVEAGTCTTPTSP